jgi:hypothetical protein
VVPGIGRHRVGGSAFREHWPSSAEVYLADGVAAPGALPAGPRGDLQRLLDEAERRARAARRRSGGPRPTGFRAEAVGAHLERAEVMDVTGERPGPCSP